MDTPADHRCGSRFVFREFATGVTCSVDEVLHSRVEFVCVICVVSATRRNLPAHEVEDIVGRVKESDKNK